MNYDTELRRLRRKLFNEIADLILVACMTVCFLYGAFAERTHLMLISCGFMSMMAYFEARDARREIEKERTP